MSTCNHRWREVHEETVFIGGNISVGWECVVEGCNMYVDKSKLTPAGLEGVVTNQHRLIGPHGGRGQCSDGSTYKEQIIDEEGKLTIIR